MVRSCSNPHFITSDRPAEPAPTIIRYIVWNRLNIKTVGKCAEIAGKQSRNCREIICTTARKIVAFRTWKMADKRHEKRYQWRKAERERRKAECATKYSRPEDVFSIQSIADAYKRVRKQSRWKASTQAFGANLFINAEKESEELLSGAWKPKGFHEFDIVERGKPRHIRSVKISEKCVQAALTDGCLMPVMTRNLIYDNGACIPGKGTDFTLRRLTEHLRWHYRHFGLSGGILLYDFHGYFDSIRHTPLEEMVCGAVRELLLMHTYRQCIDAFNVPGVPYMSQKGIGLGSHVSQISAVAYPNAIDHWIKDILGIRGYGRYNDDGYIIHPDIGTLEKIAAELEKRAAALGITMNPKKFRIIRFGKPFRFLKVRFFITDSGEVVKRPAKDAAKKERRKLRKLRSLLDTGKKPYPEINAEFHAWLSGQNKGACFHTLVSMIGFYNTLFADHGGYRMPPIRKRKQKKRRRMIRAALAEARRREISGERTAGIVGNSRSRENRRDGGRI